MIIIHKNKNAEHWGYAKLIFLDLLLSFKIVKGWLYFVF